MANINQLLTPGNEFFDINKAENDLEVFDPTSPHYTDQSKMYADGNFKNVLFYKEEVMKHAERKYHPGE